MYNARNRVYNNLCNILGDGVEILVSRTQQIAKDKSIYFEMLGNKETAEDLEGKTENANILSFQIEAYSKKLSEAYSLMDQVVSAMKSMCFNKGDVELLQNTLDTNYMRVMCRFTRLVGSGEEIEKIS